MSTALIIYGSTTGNTEFTAETVQAFLEDKGNEVALRNVSDTSATELEKNSDLYMLGTRLGTDALRIDGEPEENEITEWTQDKVNGQ